MQASKLLVQYFSMKTAYFASTSLQPHQKAYVAFELECFAVSWAMELFHHFMHGKRFQLKTDQKPLENLLAIV